MTPTPPAVYLAVTEDGEVIGRAAAYPTSLRLQFDPGVQALPQHFRLYPPAQLDPARQARALISRTPHGIPAAARLKTGGHYLVRCYAPQAQDTPLIVLNAVYAEWQWKRLQALADSALNGYRFPSRGSLARADEPSPEPELGASPLLIAGFRPRLPRGD